MGLWIAQNEHLGLLSLHHTAQTVEVHAVFAVLEQERILNQTSAIALNHGVEGSVDGRLDDNAVAALGEIVNRQSNTLDYAGNEAELFAGDAEMMATEVPVDNRLPITVGSLGVSEHRVLEPF